MKIRNDFISNSSSCSFILSANVRMADAVKLFAKTFGKNSIPYEICDKVDIKCYVKNKWFAQVRSKLDPEYDKSEWQDVYRDWRTGQYIKKDPDEVSWDSISIDFDSLVKLASDRQTLKKIDHLEFECDGDSFSGLFFLRLFYTFFEQNEMCPDCSNSEKYFVKTGSDDEKFILKLISACNEKKKPKKKFDGDKR